MSQKNPEIIQLNPGEPFGSGVLRLAREQLEAGLSTVENAHEDPEEAVHALRKRCKEIRALLRLVRDDLGAEIYHSENLFYRDLARRFSERRDRWVFAETVDLVDCPEGGSREDWAALRADLKRHLRLYHAEVTEPGRPEGFDEVAGELREARERLLHWPLEEVGNTFPAQSLRRIYARGRREWIHAREHRDEHSLHLWRKRAKYSWHHFVFLERIWPPILSPLAAEQHRLSSLLGEEHDLAILGEFLAGHPELAGSGTDLGRLSDRIEECRRERQEGAFPLGRRLYGESPDCFVARWREWWEVWRGEVE